MLRHLLEVAVSLLSGYDIGLGNSDNEGVVVGAVHIFPKQLLPSFYLFNTVFFNKEKTDHDQVFICAYRRLLKKKKRLSGSGQQPGVVSDQL